MLAFYSLTNSEWAYLLVSGLTIGFLTLSVVYLTLLFVKKINKRKKAFLKRKYWSRIEKALATILIHSLSPEEKDIKTLKRAFFFLKGAINKSPHLRQWVLEEIIQQNSNFSGESAKILIYVYSKLGLKKLSLKKLKSRKWHTRARGIIELEQMQQKDCYSLFYDFLDSKSSELRRAARLGLTSLAPNPIDFLYRVDEELSEWEQLNVAQRLSQRSKESLPDFSAHYSHDQPTVVAFCVKMSVKFGFYDHIPRIIDLLNVDSNIIKQSAIEGLTEIGAYQAGTKIHNLAVDGEDEDILIHCLKYLAVLGDDSNKPVIDQLMKHKSASVRLEAVNTAIQLGFEYSEMNTELRQMYMHHQNDLI